MGSLVRGEWATPKTHRSLWGVLLLALLVTVTPGRSEDWTSTCPKGCDCKSTSNMKVATCRAIGLTTVPTVLSSEVQYLHLEKNNIAALASEVFQKANLINMKKLFLSSNGIKEVDKNAFIGLTVLSELDLSNNKIDKLHKETFAGMEYLTTLNLGGNSFTRLSDHQFPPLKRIQNLILRNCKIDFIHDLAFVNLHSLKSLKLNDNKLKVILAKHFDNNPELNDLELDSNPWKCDCKLKNLILWAKEKKLSQSHVKCDSPEHLSERPWSTVKDHELACGPTLIIPQPQVPSAPGQNATLTCLATGDPIPEVNWFKEGRPIHNNSKVDDSKSGREYQVIESMTRAGEKSSRLTVTQATEVDLTFYTCVAKNFAFAVERNVTMVAAEAPVYGTFTPSRSISLYEIIGIAVGGLVLLLIIIICICCCWHRNRKAKKPKANGGFESGECKTSVVGVNPGGDKMTRGGNNRYGDLKQTDLLELTSLTASADEQLGSLLHRSYEESDYPAGMHLPRSRRPLAPLEEEDFDDGVTDDTTLAMDSASQSYASQSDYAHYPPDLLGNLQSHRAVSPAQLSYHSLMVPVLTAAPDWRYSYAHPVEYQGGYPVSYNCPNYPVPVANYGPVARPGYVTLPRRHRSHTWDATQATSATPQLSHLVPLHTQVDPIYDRLGPRTGPTGSSRNDLSRPAVSLSRPSSRQSQDPYTLVNPMLPMELPPHYIPIPNAASITAMHNDMSSSRTSSLPRSTPNLLDGGLGLGLQLLQLSQPQTSQVSSASVTSNASPSPNSSSSSGHRNSRSSVTFNGHSDLNGQQSASPRSFSSCDSDPPLLETSTPHLGGLKKVPPKPPPKPSLKRLSVTATASGDRKSVVLVNGETGRPFQDEGPDGTEV